MGEKKEKAKRKKITSGKYLRGPVHEAQRSRWAHEQGMHWQTERTVVHRPSFSHRFSVEYWPSRADNLKLNKCRCKPDCHITVRQELFARPTVLCTPRKAAKTGQWTDSHNECNVKGLLSRGAIIFYGSELKFRGWHCQRRFNSQPAEIMSF